MVLLSPDWLALGCGSDSAVTVAFDELLGSLEHELVLVALL